MFKQKHLKSLEYQLKDSIAIKDLVFKSFIMFYVKNWSNRARFSILYKVTNLGFKIVNFSVLWYDKFMYGFNYY